MWGETINLKHVCKDQRILTYVRGQNNCYMRVLVRWGLGGGARNEYVQVRGLTCVCVLVGGGGGGTKELKCVCWVVNE